MKVKAISLNELKNNYYGYVLRMKGDRHRVYIKGAPLDVLAKCHNVSVRNKKEGATEVFNVYSPGDDKFLLQECHVEALD